MRLPIGRVVTFEVDGYDARGNDVPRCRHGRCWDGEVEEVPARRVEVPDPS